MRPSDLADFLLNGLAPVPCWFCGQRAENFAVCVGCLADLPWLRDCCERCGQPVPEEPAACLRCPPEFRLFDRVWAPLVYEYPVDCLVMAAKFGREFAAARLLGELMCLACRLPLMPDARSADRTADRTATRLLLPVPLHWRRHASRGFNQATEIARVLGRRLRLSTVTGSCRKRRSTPTQSGLPASTRRRQLRGVFEVPAGRRRRLEGATVIVVDDVITTGATAQAVAEPLRDAGVARLELWALARTVAGPHGQQAVVDATRGPRARRQAKRVRS